MKNFKKYDNQSITDLKSYVNDWILKYPNAPIIIGTDSLEHKEKTIYATAIVLFYPKDEQTGMGSGAHVIFSKTSFDKKFDFWTRLWKEIEYSKELGCWLQENTLIETPEIHIDINSDEDYKSNRLFQAAVGYLKSFGFKVESKPYSWVASTVADYLVR